MLRSGKDAEKAPNPDGCWLLSKEWMLKLPDLMDGKEYKGHTKNKGINLEMLLQALLFHYTRIG